MLARPNWGMYYAVKRVDLVTFHVVRKGTFNPQVVVSPTFPNSGQARSWIRANWEQLYMEETLLGKVGI